jgi:allantoinase
MSNTWTLTSNKVCMDDQIKRAWITIEGQKIISISDTAPVGAITDLGDLVIMAGIVDTHVHINEPGRTEWEGFDSATHAAAAGGVTSLVDMPLNCIPVTTTAAALNKKLDSVRGRLLVDVGFWGGATADNFADLPELLSSGVLGVKTFMIDSGIPEFPPLSLAQIDKAMPIVAHAKLPHLFHAELNQGEVASLPEGPTYEQFLQSRPKAWENNAIQNLIALSKKHKTKTHIVHLSSAEAVTQIKTAKAAGVDISAETCPHYLLLSNQSVEQFEPKTERTLFKCCPPIREEENRKALWQALLDGVIDFIVSDHSPCTPSLKKFELNDFAQAWGGISSLQYSLPLLWTEGQKFGATLPKLSKWLSAGPAKFAGLSNKGSIAVGKDADFLIFDPSASWTITPESTFHRHKGSPYQGRTLSGKIIKTYLRGKLIFDQGRFPEPASGQFLLRGNH